MKKTYLVCLVLLCTIAFVACKKNDYNTPTNPTKPVDSNAMKFVIAGISDQTMDWTDTMELPLAIALTGGRQEKLTLSLTGLPSGVTGTFSSVSGTPPFTSNFILTSNDATGGTYTVKIVATTASDSIKTYEMSLKVNGKPINYAQKIAGTYDNEQTNVTNANKTTQESVVTSAGDDMVSISNLVFSDGLVPGTAMLQVDGNTKTITILLASANKFGATMKSYDVKGGGTFTDSTISLNLKLNEKFSSTVVYEYNAVLKRK